jgi:hypothetical protein
MPGCGSGVVVLPWSSPRSQHHAAVARKIHLSRLFRFLEPPLSAGCMVPKENARPIMPVVLEIHEPKTALPARIGI